MNNDYKIIIGLAGQIASGKDTVANYIVEKYGGVSLSFSDPLRDILKIAYLPIVRENFAWLAQSLINKFGGDVISKIIGKKIEDSDKQIFVLPNIRREDDASYFKDWPGYILVGIETDDKLCYERLIKRGQKEDDKTKTWEEFLKDRQLSTEVEIESLIKKSSIILNNNGSLEDLYKQIDELMQKIKRQ